MGLVYRATDVETGQEVALKTLQRLEPEQLYHLKQEFRSLAGVLHPNLVELNELVVDREQCFFTMELVDGVGFVDHVRDAGTLAEQALPDLTRLERAARQLVLGISALHAAGKLHRDVKPSNVLVTRRGRVVLLDFGLTTALRPEDGRAPETDGLAGSLAYMAPEQAWGRAPHPAADWYSVGVVLYEALTGRLPFDGVPAAVLRAKETGRCVPPERLVAGIPERLGTLVTTLLDPDPGRRPGPQDILERLDGVPRGRAGRALVPVAPDTPFVGRADELARLAMALEQVRPGWPALVHVQGASGIGKTELLRRFVGTIEAAGRALVLRGRCHAQEAVPYKALDTIVDALSRHLLAFPTERLEELMPTHTGALTRLFPVLGRVPALAAAPEPEEGAEPQEIRRRGVQALRALVAALAAVQPLVLWIDDFQWGDLDSASLLREFLRPPDAPALLLVLSYRSEHGGSTGLLRLTDNDPDHPTPGWLETLILGPLDPEAAHALAATLIAAAPDVAARAAEIATEAGGSPFFIGELSRWLATEPPTDTAAPLRLAAVVQDRLARLDEPARRILEIVSVAGGPLDRSLVLKAAGLGEGGRPVVAALRQASLLRSTGFDDRAAVETYHDRIREGILARLPIAERQARHRQIADTLRSSADPDPQALFQHYLGAGDAALAGRYAALAADHAAGALAFDRAAELFRHALRLQGETADAWPLHARLADALANAGRGREAAESFVAAATALAAQTPAGDGQVTRLRSRAAEQYLRSGHVEQGLAETRAVLGTVGVAMPRTPTGTILVALRERARLEWHGFRFQPRAPDDIPPRALLRLDAAWAASISLAVVDQTLSDALGIRHLIEALELGERSRILRALGYEAAREAALGGRRLRRRSARLLRTVARLARTGGDPFDRAWLHLAAGSSAYLGARWRRAHVHCDAGTTLFRERCTGAAWEMVTTEAYALSALAHMGDLRELGRRLPAAIRDADERGDVYGGVGFRGGVPSMHWLAQDRPAFARQQADEAIARWPTRTFHIQHYLHLLATAQADLYEGEGTSAWRRVVAAWPGLRRGLFLQLESIGVEMRFLQARAALAAAAVGGDAGWPRQRLLQVVAAAVPRIARRRVPTAAPFAELLRAGLAWSTGHGAAAADALARAGVGFARADMALYRAAVQHREGALRGGGAGRALCEGSERWLGEQGVERPAAMIAMLTPGCGPEPQRT